MNSAKNGTVCRYSNASPNRVRTPDLSASAITSVNNRLFPMPAGPSTTSTPPRPCTTSVSSAPITFNAPARPRIGGVTSWPPRLKRRGEGPTGCPVYRLLDCRCSAVIVGSRPFTRNTRRRCSACTRFEAARRRRQPNQRRRPPTTGDRADKSGPPVHRCAGRALSPLQRPVSAPRRLDPSKETPHQVPLRGCDVLHYNSSCSQALVYLLVGPLFVTGRPLLGL